MNNLITAFLIGSVITAILVLFVYLRNRSKVKPSQCEVNDLRSFHVFEVVWFNGNKFYITHWQWWSHTLDIDLTLRPVKYNLSFLDTKVDSRAVKKVVRMYAELGRKFDE